MKGVSVTLCVHEDDMGHSITRLYPDITTMVNAIRRNMVMKLRRWVYAGFWEDMDYTFGESVCCNMTVPRSRAMVLSLALQARLGSESPVAIMSQHLIKKIVEADYPYNDQYVGAENIHVYMRMDRAYATLMCMAFHRRLGAASPMAMLPHWLIGEIVKIK
jgi:hypothetical protein